jgi:hypothetical protein
MSRRTRSFIFFFLVGLFIILAPFSIVYYSGYRWDWKRYKLVKTGAFLIETRPKGASIYLEGNLQRKKSPCLIDNLVPEEYLVEIRKEGYHSWRKSLPIESKKVTFIQKVELFLKNPQLEEVPEADFLSLQSSQTDFSALELEEDLENKLKKAQGMAFSPDEEKILYWQGFELWIYYLEEAREEILLRQSQKIVDALWHPRSNYILLASSETILAVELDSRDTRNITELVKAKNIKDLLTLKRDWLYFKSESEGKSFYYRFKIQ